MAPSPHQPLLALLTHSLFPLPYVLLTQSGNKSTVQNTKRGSVSVRTGLRYLLASPVPSYQRKDQSGPPQPWVYQKKRACLRQVTPCFVDSEVPTVSVPQFPMLRNFSDKILRKQDEWGPVFSCRSSTALGLRG